MSTGTMLSGSAPRYISILNLVLGTVLSHIHMVKFFGEIAFAKKCSYDHKAACRNDSLVCIFNNYVNVFKCNMTVMIHDIFSPETTDLQDYCILKWLHLTGEL